MSDWKPMQYEYDRIHRETLLAQAEAQRLAKTARSRRPVRIYGPVLFTFGGWLMAWGSRLQAQYGELSTNLREMGSTPLHTGDHPQVSQG